MTDAGMIATQSIRNRTHLSITPEGKETLNFFENRIGDTIKQEIDTYFRENEFTLRNEVSVLGDYYKSTSGEYEAHLVAKTAVSIWWTSHYPFPWKKLRLLSATTGRKNQEIYKYLITELF